MDGIVITVRTNSKRLPKKCLLHLNNGMKTIEFLINRIKKNTKHDKIVLCTTTNKEDDILIDIAKKNKIDFFRGSENDKLDRWYNACKKYDIKNIVSVDGDDLFVEPILINKAFEQIKNCDFIKGDHTGLVCGSFTYALTFDSLRRVCELKDSENTEMMWVYFTDTGIFNMEELEGINKKFYRDDIRMTLDYKEDLDFFNEILKYNKDPTLEDIIDIIDSNPGIKEINFFRHKQWKDNQASKINIKVKNKSKFLGNEMKYVSQVLNSNKLTNTGGNFTSRLEKEFSQKLDNKYGVAFNSGTSTMHAALLAIGVKPGDEVISPALTVIMNTSTTIHAGCIPVYVDVDPETFCIDPKKIEEKITPKTKAIMIVSLYGLPCDIDEILEISKKYNIPVIEDNAECLLSTYKGKKVGSLLDMSSYSFENTKHLSCGEGGMIITNNENYAKNCRKAGGHGFKSLSSVSGKIKLDKDKWQNPDFERHDEIGWNYRMGEINSAIAIAQLERIEEIVDLRIKSAEIFLEVIKECDYLIPQKIPSDRTSSFWSVPVIYNGEEKIGVSWYDFRKKYIEFGGDGIYSTWKVPYMEPVMRDRKFVKMNPEIYKDVKYEEGLCPIAEDIQKKLMVFKTNYRNLDLAKYKSYCLKKTLDYFKQ